MGLLSKMFGKPKPKPVTETKGVPLVEKMFGKVREIRESNIDKRERIARVKRAMEAGKKAEVAKQVDEEAMKISRQHGVSYEDALEYVKSERKGAARKETIRRIAGTLHDVGVQAKKTSAQRMGPPAFRARSPFESSLAQSAPRIKPRDPFESRLFPKRR